MVGAGVVGLAHAVHALDRGATVTIVERDERPVGASVRNFGHGCLTAQVGEALGYAEVARSVWLRLGREAGFGVAECGTVVVARAPEEIAALEELADERGDDVVLLSAAEVRCRVPVAAEGLLGGAFLARDLRVEQRVAAPRLLEHLEADPRVTVLRGTPVLEVRGGGVRTGRGEIGADRVVVCTGHDLDRLAPEVADAAGLHRCLLQMLQLRPRTAVTVAPAVLTGSSMLRYPALARTAGGTALRERWRTERPEMLGAVVNHMLTQLPGGDLVVGDTHTYARTPEPWSREDLDDLLLAETRALLGDGFDVVARWQGTYAAADGEFLRAPLAPGAVAVSVTSGIGMTTAFGLAPAVLDDLLERSP